MRILSLLFILCSAETVAQTSFTFPETLPIIDRFAVVNADTLKVDNTYWFDGEWELYLITAKDSIGNIKNYMVRSYEKNQDYSVTFYWDYKIRAKKAGQIYTTYYPDGEIESCTKYETIKVRTYYDNCGGGRFAGFQKRSYKKKTTYFDRYGTKIKTEKFYNKREREWA